ncbi:MAG: lysylphosphatidylglycerol synthase domain-containing protein [Acidobacteriota bacterium]
MDPASETQQISNKRITRLKVIGILLTIGGIGLFAYLVYAIGLHEIYHGVLRFGVVGFAVILFIYFLRICMRAYAWKLSLNEPYRLGMRDTIPAVIIGEAMSNTIPLGILISGTTKAVAVRRHIPLVAGLSSVATENLFYSLTTSIFLIIGGVVLLRGFAVDEGLIVTVDLLLVSVSIWSFWVF